MLYKKSDHFEKNGLDKWVHSGKERDDTTGLYYYGARYYAPWLLRWINPDPAGTVDGLNLYQFVGNNPINYVDFIGATKKKDPYKVRFNQRSKTSIAVSRKKVGEGFSKFEEVHESGGKGEKKLHAETSYIAGQRSEGALKDKQVEKEIWKLDRSPCQNCTREIMGYVEDHLKEKSDFKLSLAIENIYTKAEGIEKGEGSMKKAQNINATSVAAMQVMFPLALDLKYARMHENVENKENTKSGEPHPLANQRQKHVNDNSAQGHAENMSLVIDPFKELAGKVEEIASGLPVNSNIEDIRESIETMIKDHPILKNLLQGKENTVIDAWKSQNIKTVGEVKSVMKAMLEEADNLIKYANDNNRASGSNKRQKMA